MGHGAPSNDAEPDENSRGGGLQHGSIEIFRYGGGAYEGELKDGQPHGRGTCKYAKNGDVYDGEWVEGVRCGRGTYKWNKSGLVYVGEIKDDQQHGWGTMKYASTGDEYEGQWMDGKKHGKGTYKWADGRVYEGENYPKQHGWGKMTWPSGKTYEGEFEGGKQHGKGTMKSASGRIYEGVWVNDVRIVCNNERQLRSHRSQQRRLRATTKNCGHCGVDDGQYKLRVCSGCNLTLYYSAACQEAARGSHKRICNISSQLPRRGADTLVLEYDKDKLVDLDAGLRYATKYMYNLKHLQINLTEMAENDTIKLSAKHLSSLLRSKKGKLESIFWLSEDYVSAAPCQGVWKELHGLKQLHLEYLVFDDVQSVCGIISQQKDTLEALCLPNLGIGLSRAKCRQSLVQAVSSCESLVKLNLDGCILMDSDLKLMLHHLPNLRILDLAGNRHYNHEFTDNTCGVIARKCPALQGLALDFHDHLQ
ncbi:hypothetical protein ACHAXT_007676 [Thalassiosira profunda]